ncbi:late competence development ComFB family protein [Cohnella faecalis]|uniref:Competence protein ComFB n=1 Tax=Cohnella faecalis TaxID=2315694 RepID=A0A398CT48_9BACL|nr:late competence development ComFB family protein [Cohnella faecalis]RIE02491.1 competence protein ComFB [Cohnella faecalis]
MKLSQELSVLNAMEPIVISTFETHMLGSASLSCSCNKCQLDIVLLALNHLPPRYTSSQAGEAYIKAQYMDPQLQSDVLKELAKAASVIGSNPNH